jgi:DNA-binding transcriptional MerR regulator
MLRHYDTLGLVRPTGRTVGGYREYSGDDIRRIFHVESLRSLGLSLRQVADALAAPGFSPAALVDDLARRTEDRIARDTELLTRLRTVDASSPQDWDGVLRVVDILHRLSSPDADRRLQTALESSAPADLLAEAALTESDPNVAGALRWAFERADGDAIAVVVRGVSSDDVEVRRRAIGMLADIAGEESTALLVAALDDPDDVVRTSSALALGRREHPRSVPTLVSMIVDGHSDVEAAEVLAGLESSEKIVDGLMSRSATADVPARIRVAQALVEIAGPAARKALEQLRFDDDRAVSLVAAAFLSAG